MNGHAKRRRYSSRFDQQAEEPLGPLANLVDIMLVFACGLIAALAASQGGLGEYAQRGGQPVQQGKEMPEMPALTGKQGGPGFEPVGKVYRDAKTGKLILIGEDNEQ